MANHWKSQSSLSPHFTINSFHILSLKYGPIMHLRLGSHSIILVSSIDMAKLFLKSHDQNFSYWPKSTAGKHLFYDYCNITFSLYGLFWQQMRKICHEELFCSSQHSSHEYIRIEELKSLLVSIFMNVGKPIINKHYLSISGFNVICRIVIGKEVFIGVARKKRECSRLRRTPKIAGWVVFSYWCFKCWRFDSLGSIF